MIINKNIIESGIYGLAVGDALGVPYEFSIRERISPPCTDMIGYGTYGKPAGTWSDDTSMTLATADALAEMKDGDYKAIMNNFSAWLYQGKYSVDGTFDVGRTCLEAIDRFNRGIAPVDCGGKDIFDNGNGSLMRILPASLYALGKRDNYDKGFIDDISSLTHGHSISRAACKIYTDIIKSILQKASKEIFPLTEIYGQSVFARLTQKEFYSLPADKINSSGYVVATLEAALWCFYNTENFRDCVLKAVNLGGDTDTVAAVAGGLAGLYYGKQSIPAEWIETLRGKDIIDKVIEKLHNRILSETK